MPNSTTYWEKPSGVSEAQHSLFCDWRHGNRCTLRPGDSPWDDDIDIGMTRENYNKFLKVAQGTGSFLLPFMDRDRPSYPVLFCQSQEKRHPFVEEMFKNVPMHPGIFVDIFPFDKIPDNKLLRRIQSEALGFLKCCLMGKEIWMWKHFGTCEIENPTNQEPSPAS